LSTSLRPYYLKIGFHNVFQKMNKDLQLVFGKGNFCLNKNMVTYVTREKIPKLLPFWAGKDEITIEQVIKAITEMGLINILDVNCRKTTDHLSSIGKLGKELNCMIPVHPVSKRIPDNYEEEVVKKSLNRNIEYHGDDREMLILYGELTENKENISTETSSINTNTKEPKEGKKEKVSEGKKEKINSKIALLDFGNGLETEDGEGSCCYLIFSNILFGNSTFYWDIRVFLYFVLKAIGNIKPSNLDMQQLMNRTDDGMAEFIDNIMSFPDQEHGDKVEKFYKSIGIDKAPEPMEVVSSEVFLKICKSFADSQLDIHHWGSTFEVKLLSSIFNIESVAITVSTKEERDENDNLRLWEARTSTDSFSPFQFVRKMFVNDYQKPIKVYIGNTSFGDHFVQVIPNKDHLKPIAINDSMDDEDNETHVIQTFYNPSPKTPDSSKSMVQKWLEIREGKLLHNLKTSVLRDGPIEIGGCYKLNDFLYSRLDDNMRCILVQLMDPLKEWYTNKIKLIDVNLDIINILTMRPGCWISTAFIDEMVVWFNAHKQNQKVIFIPPLFIQTLEGTNGDHYRREQFYNKLHQYTHAIFIAHVSGCHYVILEVEIPKQKVSKISIKYADSIKTNKNKMRSKIPLYMKYFYRMYIMDKTTQKDDFDWKAHHNKYIELKEAKNVETQNNGYDCGLCCLRRMYVYCYYNRTLTPKEIEEEFIPPIYIFRLFLLQKYVMYTQN
jgi:hypothetical protein